ncbi:hypothetical protein B9Z19DRAFT_1094720 [Tuber borchii]|uniref:Uncharacterized protein n=1 Tax=Tuber borchii TaxID=42251 RepID=A0A2T6ZDR1_TUBBO|nr:hypothetical protein B9Z19DRAFT_1094720 [Tuber borchii]
METVTSAVQRVIFGDRATRNDNTQPVSRSTAGPSTTVDEPHHSRETATDSNPNRHSTGAPEQVTFSPDNQRDKGELSVGSTDYNPRSTAETSTTIDEPYHSRETAADSNPNRHSTGAPEHVTFAPCNQRDKDELSTGSADYNPNASAFSEDLPEAADRNPNNPFIGNTDNVSSLGGKDVLRMRDEDLENRSTLEETKLNAPLGKTELGSHDTHSRSESLGRVEPESTELGNRPSGDFGKTELGNMELGSNGHPTRGTEFEKTELGKPGHSTPDLAETEGETEFGKTEFAKSTQGKTELGNSSDDYPINSNRNTNASGSLAGDHGRKEPGTGHGTGTPHSSDSNTSLGSGLGSDLTDKPSSASEATGRSHISQPPAGTNAVPRAPVEPSAGAHPSSGAQPTHKLEGADKPLEKPSSSGDHSGAPASNADDRKPLPGGMKLDNETRGEGTGERYEKSTGLAADGGDFDATRPGAGREAE